MNSNLITDAVKGND